MDVGRLCSVQGGERHTSHQRIAEYVKARCEQYPGIGFPPRVEWVAEQTLHGLRLLLAELTCTEEERRTIEGFLAIASQEIPGSV
jgi:hypothetical protein